MDLTYEQYQAKFSVTKPGQAHLATTGPDGKTCRECEHFSNEGHYSKSGKHGGSLKPGHCAKYTEFMRIKGPAVPHWAAACRHFSQLATPPRPTAE
jgi:hypothetical protein